VLRCDGFIAAPTSILAQSFTGKPDAPDPQSITIVQNPGAATEHRWPAARPLLIRDDVPYAVLKVSGFRGLAARTLLPGGIAGARLEVIYSRWDQAAQRFEAPRSV